VSGAVIQCLPDAVNDAARIAAQLGVPMHPIEVHRFPDGELRVTAGPAARTTILYGSLDRPNEKLMTLLFAAEALRRGGARRLVLVAPYLAYMRQDAAFRPGEAISQKVVGRLLGQAVDRIVTVDAHLHRAATIGDVFPDIEADDLSAMPAIAATLRAENVDPATVVMGPDAEAEPWVADLATRLGLRHAIACKERHDDRSVDVRFDDATLFAGRPVLLVDDIVSSGGTLMTCTKALLASGAASVDAIVTHALFPPELMSGLLSAGLGSIRSTASVPHPTNAIPLDAMLAEALRGELAGANQ